MKIIWKYQLNPFTYQRVEMPRGAEIVSIQMQNKDICMWAIVDPNAPKVSRRIYMIDTGHAFGNEDDMKYVGTVQEDPYVWHVFDGGEVVG